MPRTAAEPGSQSDEPRVFTTLKTRVAPDRGVTDSHSGQRRYESSHAVATAFITNLSGGAACHDVDVSLVVPQAVSSDIMEAIADMRRLMAFADTAGWRVASAEDAKAVVVAHATIGTGDDASTDSRAITLHIDVMGERPISALAVSERVTTQSMPEWGMIAAPDDVATMASGTSRSQAWRPGTLMACEADVCPVADS